MSFGPKQLLFIQKSAYGKFTRDAPKSSSNVRSQAALSVSKKLLKNSNVSKLTLCNKPFELH